MLLFILDTECMETEPTVLRFDDKRQFDQWWSMYGLHVLLHDAVKGDGYVTNVTETVSSTLLMGGFSSVEDITNRPDTMKSRRNLADYFDDDLGYLSADVAVLDVGRGELLTNWEYFATYNMLCCLRGSDENFGEEEDLEESLTKQLSEVHGEQVIKFFCMKIGEEYLADFDNYYMGHFDNDQEIAEKHLEGLCYDTELDEFMDYEKIVEAMKGGRYYEDDGHWFTLDV